MVCFSPAQVLDWRRLQAAREKDGHAALFLGGKVLILGTADSVATWSLSGGETVMLSQPPTPENVENILQSRGPIDGALVVVLVTSKSYSHFTEAGVLSGLAHRTRTTPFVFHRDGAWDLILPCQTVFPLTENAIKVAAFAATSSLSRGRPLVVDDPAPFGLPVNLCDQSADGPRSPHEAWAMALFRNHNPLSPVIVTTLALDLGQSGIWFGPDGCLLLVNEATPDLTLLKTYFSLRKHLERL